MITPRRTRLLRAHDLAGFREHLIRAVRGIDLAAVADTFVLVPTRAAGEQLRRTLEDRLLDEAAPVCLLPTIGTRADLHARFSDRLPDPPRVLSTFEREVLLGAAARDAEDAGIPPPFHLRPALLAEMLALYDHVRRQHRALDDFERLLYAELEPAAESDRGALQLLDQTRFLAAAFRGYESRLADSGGMDEHGLRQRLLTTPAPQPVRRVIVTVGDRLSDPEGLWPADVVLLTSISGLDEIDVVATEAMLAAGLLDRWRLAFVGIEEGEGEPTQPVPTLVVPQPEPGGGAAPRVFSYRDREAELEGVARRLKADRRTHGCTALGRSALVVARPLPYLYLARDVFGGAGVPFETLDTLPLAAEPYAAALDLVLDCVAEGFTRATLTALLRSPHFRFEADGAEVSPASVAAAGRALAEVRYLGGLDRLRTLAAAWASADADPSRETRDRRAALPALKAAVDAASRLEPLADPRPLIDQLGRLVAFLADHDRPPGTPATEADRRERVRSAVMGALTGLSDAYRRHDPGAMGTVLDLTPAIRRWLGTQTFAARTGAPGLQIVDVPSARFGQFDDVQVMGLVEGEWPERPRRNIFYPPSLLAPLEPGRPEQVEVNRERDQLRAGRALFHDLMHLARLRTRVSTFALESDSVVEPSVLLDEVAGMGLPTETQAADPGTRVFAYEALALRPQIDVPVGHPLKGCPTWAEVRIRDGARDSARFHGEAGPWTLPRVSVSRLELYLKCPFQFYASNVLRLEEEPEDEITRSPLERGRFLHQLFESFFHDWQRRGHLRITPATLSEARALFAGIAEPALASLAPSEAGLERTRLFGSAVGAGIAERVFAMEAERPVDIRERLMEYALDGVFAFAAADGSTREVRLRAKIDRVDLLADGTFRLIDYKTRFVLDRKLALQLPVYSQCVRERLSREQGRDVPPSEAMYLSFEGDKGVVPLEERGKSIDDLMETASHRLVAALDGIAAGHFPPRPYLKSLCGMCAFTTVCRDKGNVPGEGSLTGEEGLTGAPDE